MDAVDATLLDFGFPRIKQLLSEVFSLRPGLTRRYCLSGRNADQWIWTRS